MADRPTRGNVVPPNPPSRKGETHGGTAGKSGSNVPAQRIREIGGFELLTKIGQGGMATVFKARQRSLDRVVALKILPPSIAKDAEFLERFQREARASAKLNHPNIVLGIDVGRDEATGLWYFAMELIDGPSVGQVLKDSGAMPEEQALEIVVQVARALDYIAAHGMVHRDIKPDNILLTQQGEAKLADLGLAKQLADDAALTRSGDAIGSPHYMAPEQVRGQRDQFDIRTDIYALGSTLFHLVTGKPPFSGNTGAVIMSKHLTEPIPSARRANPNVSEGCARLIERMMQKKREDRPQTPAEVLRLIEKVRKGDVTGLRQPVRAATTGPHAGIKRSKREQAPPPRTSTGARLVVGLVALVAIGLVVAAVALPGGISGLIGGAPPAEKKGEDTKVALVEPKTPSKTASPVPPEKKEAPETKKAQPAPETPELAVKTKPDAKTVADKGDGEPELIGPPLPLDFVLPEPGEAAQGKGGGFRADYYVGENFDTLKTTTQDQNVDFRWKAGAPDGFMPRVGFSARWSGFVEPPESGEYVFDIISQAGSRLHIGSCVIFDSWGGKGAIGKTIPVSLEKGKKYPLRFELHNRSSDNPAVASLKWGLVGQTTVMVNADPPEAIDPAAAIGALKGGWRAEYGKVGTPEPLVTRTEMAICWDWHNSSPAPEIPPDKFWGNWTGLVVPEETDDYVFHVASDEGARLSVNGMLVADYFNLGAGKADTLPLRLEKGKSYLVRLEYMEWTEYASCSLRWSSKTFKEALIRSVGVGEATGTLPPDGFMADYYVSGVLKAVLTRREIQIGWNWKSGAPGPDVTPDKFSAVYTGWITPPADGDYTFSLDYDEGVRLYLDDVQLYDSGGRGGEGKPDVGPIALKGGKHYALRVEYWEHTEYARIFLFWRSQDMPKRIVTGVIPEAVTATAAAPGGKDPAPAKDIGRIDAGVLAEYGITKNSVLKRLEARIFHNFHYGTPGPEVPSGVFWGKWVGGLRVATAGQYSFQLEAEAAAELRLRSVPVLKVPIAAPKGPKPAVKGADPPPKKLNIAETPPLPLEKNQIYLLELNYSSRRPGDEPSYVRLLWKPPGKTEYEEIPPDVLVQPPTAREAVKKTAR